MSEAESDKTVAEEAAAAEPIDDGTTTAEDVSPIAALEAERDKLRDQLLRTAADFDNFRKRARKDLEHAEKRSREDVLRELLPIFDNLERAAAAAETVSEVQSIREGVRMVLKLFDDTAARLGMARVATIGERFDPMLHEALQQRETDEVAPGTIVAEIQAGWRLADRLVRPAMVVVARKPQGETSG